MGIALLNEELEFITCNPALLHKLSFSMGELHTKTLLELCHPWDRTKAESIIQAAGNKDSLYLRDEIRLSHKEEPYLWVEISVQHIPQNDTQAGSFVVMVQNIQKRKEMQLEVLELRRRLLESNEMERKKFAQDLHDGPMQDLHSISYQIASMPDNIDPEVQEVFESILKTVSKANRDLRAIAYNLRPPRTVKIWYGSVDKGTRR
jgi:PAS domain S-box-containing protein